MALRALCDQGSCTSPSLLCCNHPRLLALPRMFQAWFWLVWGKGRGGGEFCISSPFCPGHSSLWLPSGLLAHFQCLSNAHFPREAWLVVLHKIAALPTPPRTIHQCLTCDIIPWLFVYCLLCPRGCQLTSRRDLMLLLAGCTPSSQPSACHAGRPRYLAVEWTSNSGHYPVSDVTRAGYVEEVVETEELLSLWCCLEELTLEACLGFRDCCILSQMVRAEGGSPGFIST